MITIHINEKVIDEHNSINLQIITTIYKIKNEKNMKEILKNFDRNVWREKKTSIPPLFLIRDQNINLSYIKD